MPGQRPDDPARSSVARALVAREAAGLQSPQSVTTIRLLRPEDEKGD